MSASPSPTTTATCTSRSPRAIRRERRLLMATGLMVWIDAGGGKKKSYGIRFPGALGPAGGWPGARSAAVRVTRARRIARPEPPLPPLTWFELVGPREDDRRRLERRGGDRDPSQPRAARRRARVRAADPAREGSGLAARHRRGAGAHAWSRARDAADRTPRDTGAGARWAWDVAGWAAAAAVAWAGSAGVAVGWAAAAWAAPRGPDGRDEAPAAEAVQAVGDGAPRWAVSGIVGRSGAFQRLAFSVSVSALSSLTVLSLES